MKGKRKKGKRFELPPPLTFDRKKFGELDNPLKLMKFMAQATIDVYESKLWSRQASALNGAIRNMMDSMGMGDYRLEEMSKRIEELEKTTGIRAKGSGTRTIQGIATPIQDS
jgi:hypothetical protein